MAEENKGQEVMADHEQLNEKKMLALVKVFGLEIKENNWNLPKETAQSMTLVCPDERKIERTVYKADGKQVILEELRAIWIDVGAEWKAKCIRKELGI